VKTKIASDAAPPNLRNWLLSGGDGQMERSNGLCGSFYYLLGRVEPATGDPFGPWRWTARRSDKEDEIGAESDTREKAIAAANAHIDSSKS
jgi:hypothetical protein